MVDQSSDERAARLKQDRNNYQLSYYRDISGAFKSPRLV
jgi:hypothetical protein